MYKHIHTYVWLCRMKRRRSFSSFSDSVYVHLKYSTTLRFVSSSLVLSDELLVAIHTHVVCLYIHLEYVDNWSSRASVFMGAKCSLDSPESDRGKTDGLAMSSEMLRVRFPRMPHWLLKVGARLASFPVSFLLSPPPSFSRFSPHTSRLTGEGREWASEDGRGKREAQR